MKKQQYVKYFCQTYSIRVLFLSCYFTRNENKKHDFEIRDIKSPFTTVQSKETDLRDMHASISRTNVYLDAAMLK